jgi:dihydropteroate synthase-like protein
MAPRILFVTGKLAEPALRRTLEELAPVAGFSFSVTVLPITVAALTTTPWVASHLEAQTGIDRIVLPGLCGGDLELVRAKMGTPVDRGPKDLRDLPEFFGARDSERADYGRFDIQILAEINHAPRLEIRELLAQAHQLWEDGADMIDLGCDPGETWSGLAVVVRALCEDGLRVSIDTFNPLEAEAGARAGAELILSVNKSNRTEAHSWRCEVVAVPDVPGTLDGLDETIAFLQGAGIAFRIDPVLEPIGFGFARSLGRYLEVRRRYPSVEILMGIGNLTELTDVDSAGVNVMLLGFCQEAGIRSVLTTQVINWCRSCVRELDLARRLVHHACTKHTLPKHLESELLMLRDPKLREYGEQALREIAARLTDANFRIFAERDLLHVFNRAMFVQGADPFDLFEEMQKHGAIDSAHAFYLGYEMAKAVTALTLGKNYVQDQALRWGFLTAEEKSHRGQEKPGA